MSALEAIIDVKREDWLPRSTSVKNKVSFKPISRWEAAEVHHTGSHSTDAFATWKSAYRYHVENRGWSDIWYQLGIHPDGRIVELRGAGASNSSRPYMAVNFPGNDQSTPEQWNSLYRIREAMKVDGAKAVLRYHAMRGGTVCPGTRNIAEIHRIWAAEKVDGGALVNNVNLDPEAHLINLSNIVRVNHPIVAVLDSFPRSSGYATVHADGGVSTFGEFPYLGSIPESGVDITKLEHPDPITHAQTVWYASQPGYRMFSKRGGVFNFGSAQYHGRLDIIGD